MSVFQYMACVDGASGDSDGLTAREEDELWEWLQEAS